uniref:Uncharacterized protein n=1 Tax=Oryza glumipatula TaxID=40148 RepID=A0A0E0ACT4_9ORYZ
MRHRCRRRCPRPPIHRCYPCLRAATLRLGMLPPGGEAGTAASSVGGGFGIRWVVGVRVPRRGGHGEI